MVCRGGLRGWCEAGGFGVEGAICLTVYWVFVDCYWRHCARNVLKGMDFLVDDVAVASK